MFTSQAGSFYVYLYAVSPVVPPSLLQLANQTLTPAFPIQGTALSPDLVGISLSTTLSFTAGVSPADQPGIIATATSAASTYINNLPIGQPLIINQLAAVILGADSRISDIGLTELHVFLDGFDTSLRPTLRVSDGGFAAAAY